MGKGGSTARTTVAEYRMSIHYGVCHGPVDQLQSISVGEKVVWEGGFSGGTISINQPDIFGGNLKEGGVAGRVIIMGGDENQLLTAEAASKLGGTPSNLPGFRGILSLFFLGLEGARNGFYWSANSPYLKNPSFRVRRSPKGFYPAKAMIGADANPIHIIYECLTNGVWGMGGSPGQIDSANFMEAADAIYNEGLGLSLMWSGQTTIQSFVQEVLDHIEATFFTNPKTGLFNIKLIRPDFDVENLFHLTDDNSVIQKFQRKGWGETINEINATWTNPVNEQEENVTVHDLGNIASQGEIVPSSRNYYGVRNSLLALRLAQRDLAAAAFPLASCEAIVSRAAWKEVPGGVVKVSSTPHGLSELVMRVGSISYGRQGDPDIKVTLVEDVFALPDDPYVESPDTEWQDPTVAPDLLAYSRFSNVTYYAAARAFGDAAAEAVEYPQSYVAILGAQDTPGTTGIEAYAEGVDSVGTVAFRRVSTIAPSGRGTLSTGLALATSSALPDFSTYFGNVGLEVGTLVLFDGGTDANSEMALIESVTGGVATVRRGVLDTVPQAWLSGTTVWVFRPVSLIYDPTARAAGQTAKYKLLPRTSLGVLPLEDAPQQDFVVGARMHRPFRPANVKANGTLFGPASLDYGADGLTLTWANRNRLSETSQVAAWGDANVTPEAGQTTSITVYNSDNSVLQSVTGLTGTTWTATFLESAITGPSIRYEIKSVRDGLDSLQSLNRVIPVI